MSEAESEGKLDLHPKRGAVDLAALGERIALAGGAPALVEAVRGANSGLHAFELAQAAGFDLPKLVADGAWATAARVLAGQPGELETVIVGRDGRVLASSRFRRVQRRTLIRRASPAIGRSEERPSRDGLRRRMRALAESVIHPRWAHRGNAAHKRRCKARSRESPRPQAPGRRE
jgi:hypothetical protein